MTEDQWCALDSYLRDMADRLRLRDWVIVLYREPPRDDAAHATVRRTYGQLRACVRVAADFVDETPERQREIITHELLHCHLDNLQQLLVNAQTNLGDAAWGILDGAHKDAIEIATDALTGIIAPHLPLWNREGA